jgi:hypothetical protein
MQGGMDGWFAHKRHILLGRHTTPRHNTSEAGGGEGGRAAAALAAAGYVDDRSTFHVNQDLAAWCIHHRVVPTIGLQLRCVKAKLVLDLGVGSRFCQDCVPPRLCKPCNDASIHP